MRDWDDFDKFETEYKDYWVAVGQGTTMATQVVIAVAKLVYKWFNDGDVYDNTHQLDGWLNDLSSFANWLYKYIPKTQPILDGISDCYNEADYTELLYELCEATLNKDYLDSLNTSLSVGSIYKCDGPFEFDEYEDDEHWY